MLRQFGSRGVNLDDISTWFLDRDNQKLEGNDQFIFDVVKMKMIKIGEYEAGRKYHNYTEVAVSSVYPLLTISFCSNPEKTVTFSGIMSHLVFDSLCNGSDGEPVRLTEAEVAAAALEEMRTFRAIRLEVRVVGDPPDLTLRQVIDMAWANYTQSESELLQFPPPAILVFTNETGEKLLPSTHVSQAPHFMVSGQ